MDFEKILRVARKNELNKKEPVKCLQTKFKPPTKEQHEKARLLSEGVQRFLAKKEEEEKRKQKEAERRKLELMALRAKDPKANKRIQTMLKRTKSANKSVMEDAVDTNNTADTLAGPSQPDEDDYGFVSETSSQLYNKLIQKMYSTPSNDVPKFAPSKKPSGGNLSNTKERVKMALLKQEEEERSPTKRKRKSKRDGDDDDDDGDNDISLSNSSSQGVQEQNKEKPKVKRPMPPPVDFHELLKIAEQKQHEPIVFEPKVKKTQEPEVLMTKKQKLEHEKMQEWKRQRELRLQNLENGGKSSPTVDQKKAIPKIPKLNQSNPEQKVITSQRKVNGVTDKSIGNKTSAKPPDKIPRNSIPQRTKETFEKGQKPKISADKRVLTQGLDKKHKVIDDETNQLIKERDEALQMLREKERLIRERDEAVRLLKEKEQLIKERDEVMRKLKLLEQSEKLKSVGKDTLKTGDTKSVSSLKKTNSEKTNGKSSNVSKSGSTRPDSANAGAELNSLQNKSMTSSSKLGTKPGSKAPLEKTEARVFPPRDLKPVARSSNQVNRNIQRSKQFPPADVRRKAMASKRRIIESDDEYDSELDDFIDDETNDMGADEVSKVISEIFRYDKNKYSKYDDMDDECMESNYAQISKEEYFSTKCGLLEDLQDIQREKAKLARKQKR
ncbi:hypothetical protein RUM43_006321 [Polyplax serrata]|uniref:SPT2 homolog N-terminal domain-containing protein n=1 Tax=Polyplax serrata TaxID=468196 RepID=A0AAN8NXM6_POLSC